MRILLFTWAVVFAGFSVGAQETFETLAVGAQVYSNVTVTTKTRTDVFISHAHGIASIKVRDLDDETQVKLGFEPPKPVEPPKKKLSLPSLPTSLQIEPAKVREIQEQVTTRAKDRLKEVKPVFVIVVLGVILLFYLLHCYLCRLICLKAGTKPGVLIWFPVLQSFPLLKAAGMSGLWFIAFIVPVLNIITGPIAGIVWAWNISKARGKSGWTALGLCLPVFNIIAFLYLALADSLPEDESSRNVVRFHSDRRSAA